MAKQYTNLRCRLFGTDYCRMLNMPSCEECTVNRMKSGDVGDVVSDLDTVKSLLPDEGRTFSTLYTGDKCLLCKGEERGSNDVYAMTDLANPAPERNRKNFLGLKTKSAIGTMLPVQISCCNACKRRLLTLEYIVIGMCVGFTGLGLLLMSIRPLREPLAAVNELLPVGVFLAFCIVGIVLGNVMRAVLLKKYADKTHLDIMEIDVLKDMKPMNWRPLFERKGFDKLVFSKERLKRGLYTASAEEMAEQAEADRPAVSEPVTGGGFRSEE